MSYMHIENLYKNATILLFRECYALEKVHGTSAHIAWRTEWVHFFAGGAPHDSFVALFDQDQLRTRLAGLGHKSVTVYGEAYGGKMQGMRDTYGDQLRFIAFEVEVEDRWLSVPQAESLVRLLGLEFVPYRLVSTDIAVLNQERDADSEVAKRCLGPDAHKPREGIVLRPLMEMQTDRNRVIAKYKRDEFRETHTLRPVMAAARVAVLTEADGIADEWVTEMRLSHVLDKLHATSVADTGSVVHAMLEDVLREGAGELVDSREARKAISRRTACLFQRRFKP